MGHYDEQREEHERKELAERGARYGRTADEQEAHELHGSKLERGKALLDKQQKELELMLYYLKNS